MAEDTVKVSSHVEAGKQEPKTPREVQEQIKARLQNSQRQAEELRDSMEKDARELRSSGVTWAEIGSIVGISAQAAYQRWSEAGNKKHRERQQARRSHDVTQAQTVRGTV